MFNIYYYLSGNNGMDFFLKNERPFIQEISIRHLMEDKDESKEKEKIGPVAKGNQDHRKSIKIALKITGEHKIWI